ncbi:MAG: FprA family A-type flavoprotein [Thermoanaerobacteraceae bacterium]|nr:FprA family A-type flavoprotein [Thermoanaerobacteraceae bacterium]
MAIRKVKEDIYSIGVKDPNLRKFDIVFDTPWGTTYNSYLIMAEKPTVVETSKEGFHEEFLTNLKTLIDPSKIEYIVLDHSEPDHSWATGKLLEMAPNAKVVATRAALANMKAILNRDFPSIAAMDGSELDLGDRKLRFIYTPFLHWPDTMITYDEHDKILFTCDAFGCHYCPEGDRIFNDEVGDFTEALWVYFNSIISPFKPKVLEAVNKLRNLNLNFDMICPGHGPILREDPFDTIALYEKWAQEPKYDSNKVTVYYVSAYGNTKKTAERIACILREKGLNAHTVDAADVSKEVIDRNLQESAGIVVGSPTIAADVVEPIWNVLVNMNPIKAKGKVGAAFGSFGWSGEALKIMEDMLKSRKMDVVEPGIKVNFSPSQEDLNKIDEFASRIADKILNKQN